jgi:hypothetical protein
MDVSRVVYSRDDPPYWELIEAHGDGFCNIAQAAHVHHPGFWSTDVDATRDELIAKGLHTSALARRSDGRLSMWTTDSNDLFGIRLEYVSTEHKPLIEAWAS